jgi:hypothetical protein
VPGTLRRLGILTGLTLVLRAPSFVHPIMDLDETSYAAIACRMMQGGLPYRHAVENKFPGTFYVYYAAFELFGRYNMLAIHLLTALVALLTALVCGAIATRVATPRAGWLAALLYTVYSTFYYPQMLAANAEMFVVLPSALAVWLYLRGEHRWPLLLLSGAVAGVATLFKQVAGATLGALCADRGWAVLRGRLRISVAARDTGLMLAGFAAVLGAMATYLAHIGALDDALFWTWSYIFRHYIPAGTRSQGFLFNLVTRFLPFLASVAPLLLLAARVREARLAPIWWWLIGMTGAAFVGGRMYGHYFLMMLPALVVLGGIAADRWLGEPMLARRWRLLAGVTAAGAIGFLIAAMVYEGSTSTFWRPIPDYRLAGDYVRQRTSPEDRVFVWGWFPALYLAADRCPSTRFVYTHVLAGEHGRSQNVPEGWQMLLDDLTREPPLYVLDTSPGNYTSFAGLSIDRYPRLAEFVHRGYQVEAEVEGIRIYRRRTELGQTR